MRPQLPILLVLFSGACVDKGPGPTRKQIDPAYIQKNLLTEPPASMDNPIHANLGGKVVYLGNDVDTDELAPGGKAKIVHYWKVIEPPGAQWRVFTHLVGATETDWQNIDYSDMRTGHGPDKWQAGQIIRDEQEILLPESWRSSHAQVLVGMFPKGGQTARDRMPVVSGPADDESRVPVLRFKVTREASPAQDVYVIRRAPAPVTVDGRADEPAWRDAPRSPEFSVAEGSPNIEGTTRARMLWDDEHLYVFVEVEDSDVFSPYRDHDDPLWKQDVIELFIDADRNRRGYVELQVNPNNAHFDSYFATTRRAPGDTAWNANMNTAVVVHGTADNREDSDKGWDAEIAVPLAAVKGTSTTMRVNTPPRIGDKWRLNVVRIDKPEDGKLAVASWNRITYQDFHALGRMLEVQFGDAAGKTEPPAPEKTPAEPKSPAAKPKETPAAKPKKAPAAKPKSPAATPKKTPAEKSE